MSQKNSISFNLTDAETAEINNSINVLKTKLFSKLITLSSSERVELLKMGDKTLGFVQKSYDYAVQNPDIIPAFLNLDEFKIDVTAVVTLRNLFIQLEQITDAISDTMTLSGSEAYQAALAFYNAVKNGAKAKIGNSETIYADLSTRFPGSRGIKKETQAVTDTAQAT